MGQRVEEGVGRRVVRLARRAQERGRRRVEHEEVERQPARQLVEHPRALHLGPEHAGQALPVQVQQRAVVEDAREVDDPAERRQVAPHLVERPGDSRAIADVGLKQHNPRALMLQRGRRLPRRDRVRAAREEGEMARAAADHPAGEREAERAQSAGQEVRPVCAQAALRGVD